MITFAFLNCHASLGNCSFTSLKIELSCGIYHQQSLPPLVWCSRADRNLRGWRPCLAEAGCMRGKRSEAVSALTCMSRCCLCVYCNIIKAKARPSQTPCWSKSPTKACTPSGLKWRRSTKYLQASRQYSWCVFNPTGVQVLNVVSGHSWWDSRQASKRAAASCKFIS